MTSQTQAGEDTIDAVSAKEVVSYLKSHPDFFIDHPQLLINLEVPHSTGKAVSLIERQVALLRVENKQLRQRIKDLVEIARENEELIDKLHQLSLKLISAKTLPQYVETLKEQIQGQFDSNVVGVKLMREAFAETPELPGIWITREDDALTSFENFLQNRKSICGRFNTSQLKFLFGDDAELVKSMALVPLVNESTIGMIAIASDNPEHYRASMSTSFLSSLADVTSAVLTHFQQ